MTTYYVSYENGDDTTGDGSSGNPYRTYVQVKSAHSPASGDETRVEKTSGQTTTSAATCTFTDKSNTITTSASLVGTVAVGDYIGKDSGAVAVATGNGNHETFYKVTAIDASSMTIDSPYYDSTRANSPEAVGTIKVITPFYEADRDPFELLTGDTVTGGWNLSGTPARDGETHIRVQYTSSSEAVLLRQGSTFQYMNIYQQERGAYVSETSGSGGFLLDCSFIDSRYTGIRCYPGGEVERCVSNSVQLNSTSYAPLEWEGGTMDDTLGISDYMGMRLYNGAYEHNNNGKSIILFGGGTSYGCLYTLLKGEIDYGDMTLIPTSSVGIYVATDGAQIRNMEIDGATTGITVASGMSYAYIENMTIKNCTVRGVYSSQGKFNTYVNCSFESNYQDIHMDTHCGNTKVINCDFLTPGDYSIYPGTDNTGLTTCIGCTIDAPSIGKAFRYITSQTNVTGSQFIFVDSFGINGQYYPHMTITQSDAELSPTTSSNTLAVTLNTTLTSNTLDIPIWGTYVGLNQGKSITVQYKSTSGSWSGTVVPVLKLNGAVVTTGTSITSVTTSWQSYGISVADIDVTQQGLLTLELQVNSNTAPLYFGEVATTG